MYDANDDIPRIYFIIYCIYMIVYESENKYKVKSKLLIKHHNFHNQV